MTKKQKKMLLRIIIAAVMLAARCTERAGDTRACTGG